MSRIDFFGTYDAERHPRVAVLREGVALAGRLGREWNVPLRASTAERTRGLRSPASAARLVAGIGHAWRELVRRTREVEPPETVVVGYFGHLDAWLARRLFPRARIVLDHLVDLDGAARERGVPRPVLTTIRALDRAARRRADVVLVDTDERLDEGTVVCNVGAESRYFDCESPQPSGPLRVLYLGLFTPFHGAPVLAEAARRLEGAPVAFTFAGSGPDEERCRRILQDTTSATWVTWTRPEDLPRLISSHDVMVGALSNLPRTLRVVPTKLYQGAAVGLTPFSVSSPAVRRAFGEHAVFVPGDDAPAVASAIARLALETDVLRQRREEIRRASRERFHPRRIVEPLFDAIGDLP